MTMSMTMSQCQDTATLTKPNTMTVIKPQISTTFSSNPIDRINNINDKTGNVKMIVFTNQNQNMLKTIKNGNASFRVFWHKKMSFCTSLHSLRSSDITEK